MAVKIIKQPTVDEVVNAYNAIDKHSVYGWSGNGEKLSTLNEQWFYDHDSKGKSYAEKSIKRWKENKKYPEAICADCSGSIIYVLRLVGAISATADHTADALHDDLCADIPKSQLQKGDFVFKEYKTEKSAKANGKHVGDKYHIGIVVDDKGTIKSFKGRSDVAPYTNETGWNCYSRPVKLYAGQPADKGTPIYSTIKKGVTGRKGEIKALQSALEKAGFSVGRYGIDGSYGPDTRKAVSNFQKKYPECGNSKGQPDEKAGPATIKKLGELTKSIYWAGK